MEIEEAVLLPIAPVLRCNIDILEIKFVSWDIDLDILTGLELDVLSLRKFDCKLLDKGSHVVI